LTFKQVILLMKKFFFLLLLSPLDSSAQFAEPRFEKDTLYTSGGYKIYKGQTLYLGTGTSADGYFRFVSFHSVLSRTDTYILQNSSILVNRIRNFKAGSDYSIRISGTVTYKNGSKAETDIILDFERAINNNDGLPGELIVPEEFRIKGVDNLRTETKQQDTPAETKKQAVPDDLRKLLVADEIKKLFDLYKAGALSKEEYEFQKKKLLERQ
jgi:Short C-terminal domain